MFFQLRSPRRCLFFRVVAVCSDLSPRLPWCVWPNWRWVDLREDLADFCTLASHAMQVRQVLANLFQQLSLLRLINTNVALSHGLVPSSKWFDL